MPTDQPTHNSKPKRQTPLKALQQLGLTYTFQELPGSTRSASEASRAIGCRLGQIAQIVGERLQKAAAEYVRKHTGYACHRGVPPIGHTTPLEPMIDRDLFGFSVIWAAAGTPHAVFNLTPDDLVKLTGGRVSRIS